MKYDAEQLQTLKTFPNDGDPFTAEEIKALEEGTAPLKLSYRADKALQLFERFSNGHMSRREAGLAFPSRNELRAIQNSYICLTRTLIRLGMITEGQIKTTQHEMQAEQWPHICGTCNFEYPMCDSKPKYASDIFDDLPDRLAGRVVGCDKYTEKSKGGE